MRTLSLLACFLFACSTPGKPLRVSVLPPVQEVENLLPPEPELPSCSENAERFDDLPVFEGEQNGTKLPAGVLVDECTYTEAISDKARAKRLDLELRYTRALRDQERKIFDDVETAYQRQLNDLEDKNWWERSKYEIGILSGVALTLGVLYATDKVRQ